jgi:hypothetical protein
MVQLKNLELTKLNSTQVALKNAISSNKDDLDYSKEEL